MRCVPFALVPPETSRHRTGLPPPAAAASRALGTIVLPTLCPPPANPHPPTPPHMLPGYVDLSVINGEQIIREGRLLTCDLQQLLREHAAASARVCAAVGPSHM